MHPQRNERREDVYQNANGSKDMPERETCFECQGALSTMNSGREEEWVTPVIMQCGHVFHNRCRIVMDDFCKRCNKCTEVVEDLSSQDEWIVV